MNANSGTDTTLPHIGFSEPSVYQYPGGMGGNSWDCAVDGYDSSTFTRLNVTELSNWGVGDRVIPTAVTLQAVTARPFHPIIPLIIPLVILTLITLYTTQLSRPQGPGRRPTPPIAAQIILSACLALFLTTNPEGETTGNHRATL